MKLYETTQALARLELIETDEDLTEYLDGVQLQINEKVDNIVKFRQNLTAQAEAIQTEIDRLESLKKSYTSKSESLKTYVACCMTGAGIKRIDTDIAKLYFRESQAVEITDASKLNKKYLVTKTTVTPDKVAIKEAIKSGEQVDGAALRSNLNLQIK